MDLFVLWEHAAVWGQFNHLYARKEQEDPYADVDEANLKEVRGILKELEAACNKLQLDAVADLINFTCCRNNFTNGDLTEWFGAISFLLQSQAAKQRFFRLSKQDSEMFENDELFGSGVAEAFPSKSTTYEITEAGNCLALGRYTATVFHLMRVLERGLRALSDNLQVPFSIPFDYLNWRNIIDPIEAKIRDLEKQRPGQQKTETLKAYSEIAKQFRYFKDAWRNGVAHSRETYGPEEALSIFRHAKEFMQDIVKLGLKE